MSSFKYEEIGGFTFKGVEFSQDSFNVIAGPCTIENYQDLKEIALQLQSMGINLFRGGAYKMRTSPYSFQGLGKKGLEYIKKVSLETGMISVSEIVSKEDLPLMQDYVDILQVGTRNMYNFRLLSALGEVKNPILLKRGMSSTIEEWLLAAEHIIQAGNPRVILCERGIRTFENYTRNTLDISAVCAVKQLSKLPIIVDPSHSSGRREMIKSLSWAAVAAGANGLMIETHFCPDETVCDSRQTVTLELLREILKPIDQLRSAWK
ncbi:MAG: 3-deoxy-7-phosphoheptulonate synthase [Candidatus Cloacimonadota bacterium]|jgi:3-deoxy-7-phosphoheptulonate synthase|nr:3-deoxy-7-phosphoheptulonate synthase [Candidatus Cloacimonadota bacterium]